MDNNDMDLTPKLKKAMSRDEVALFVDLVLCNPILTSKETNAATNKLKEECWSSLTQTFNEKNGQIPRSLPQLKLKWDNLKKAARKRAANIRLNNLKTGGGKPDFIPPDDILEKVTGILGTTCTGFDVPFGGDGVDVDVTENVIVDREDDDDIFGSTRTDTLDEHPLLLSASANIRKIDFSPQAGASKGAENKKGAKHIYGMTSMSKPLQSKVRKPKRNQEDGRHERNLAIAKYYEKKTEKLDLEIKKLKMELNENNNCYNNNKENIV